jgi:lysophospholipase L1-like esterase
MNVSPPKPALLACVLAACLARAAPAPAPAPPAGTWIGTWGAAPQQPFDGDTARWADQTLRLVVHASAAGRGARIQLSNTYGDAPLVIGAAHLALRTAGADVAPASDRTLRFGGLPSIAIPPGASVLSDPVDLEVPALSDLAISLYLPRATAGTTLHSLALQTGYVSPPGDASGSARFPVAATIATWPFVTRVDVLGPADGASTVVVFGDSLVDGDGSTADANRRFTDVLAARLHAAGASTGVLNEGIIGNRLLRPSPAAPRSRCGPAFGDAGLDRFARDALVQPGVAAIVVRIGANDLGFPGAIAPESETPGFDQLVAGYRALASRAHRRGLRIVATTCPPFEGAAPVPGYWAPAKEPLRQRVNAWLRDGRVFDAVVDLDRVLRDPQHPSRLAPAFDSGDHLHPGDAGHAAIAAAIPLRALAAGIVDAN